MKYFIIAFCLLLIALALWLLIRHIRKMSRGDFCGDCSRCPIFSEQCGDRQKGTAKKPENNKKL